MYIYIYIYRATRVLRQADTNKNGTIELEESPVRRARELANAVEDIYNIICMCIYIHMYMYIYIYIYTCIHAYIHTRTYMHTHKWLRLKFRLKRSGTLIRDERTTTLSDCSMGLL